jgi:hypothetical protein
MTGETLRRVTDLDEPAVYECAVCGGRSRTRLPNHDDDCAAIADEVAVYNRPAVVERATGDVVRVRFKDNGLVSHVALEEVTADD